MDGGAHGETGPAGPEAQRGQGQLEVGNGNVAVAGRKVVLRIGQREHGAGCTPEDGVVPGVVRTGDGGHALVVAREVHHGVGKAAQAFAAFHHQPCDVLEILAGGGVAGAVEGAQEQFARHGGILESAHGAAASGQIVELFEGKEGFYLAQAVGRSAVQRDGGLGADGRTLAAAHAVFLVAGAHHALFEAEAEQGADLGAEAAADTAFVVDMYHGVFLFFAVRKLPPA